MMVDLKNAAQQWRELADLVEHADKYPCGSPSSEDDVRKAGDAMTRILGSRGQALSLYKVVVENAGGYFPQIVADTLITLAEGNLVPFIAEEIL